MKSNKLISCKTSIDETAYTVYTKHGKLLKLNTLCLLVLVCDKYTSSSLIGLSLLSTDKQKRFDSQILKAFIKKNKNCVDVVYEAYLNVDKSLKLN